MEGYQEGTITEVFQIIQVHKNKNGIYNYHLKTKGWVSKEECLKLAKEGALDLVVCLSQQGHEYLRARKGSSINGSLDKLVVNPTKEKRHNSSQTQASKEKTNAAY